MDGFIIYIIVMLIVLAIYVFFFGIPKGYRVETSLTLVQVKDYFIKKHYCKDCHEKLKRISHDEYKGTGWTKSMGEFKYGEQYKVAVHLECPNCKRVYTSDDL